MAGGLDWSLVVPFSVWLLLVLTTVATGLVEAAGAEDEHEVGIRDEDEDEDEEADEDEADTAEAESKEGKGEGPTEAEIEAGGEELAARAGKEGDEDNAVVGLALEETS